MTRVVTAAPLAALAIAARAAGMHGAMACWGGGGGAGAGAERGAAGDPPQLAMHATPPISAASRATEPGDAT